MILNSFYCYSTSQTEKQIASANLIVMMIGKVLRAGLQSGTIMGMADMSIQVLVEGKNIATATTTRDGGREVDVDVDVESSYDGMRTLRWALMGLVLHGPYFLTGFSIIDRRFAAAAAAAGTSAASAATVSWKTVAKKTASAQLFLFPPYLVLLFGFLGVLEGEPDILGKIKTRVPEAFLSGCVYWPVANSINFKLVPNHLRVPYLALSAGVWNSYLSYTNSSTTINHQHGMGSSDNGNSANGADGDKNDNI